MHATAKARPSVLEIPGRSEAESALETAIRDLHDPMPQSVVLVPDHLLELTDKGEFDTADRALVAVCQDFIRAVPPGSRVYRWSAISLLATTDGACPPDRLRLSALGAVCVFALAESDSVERSVRELDHFVAKRSA